MLDSARVDDIRQLIDAIVGYTSARDANDHQMRSRKTHARERIFRCRLCGVPVSLRRKRDYIEPRATEGVERHSIRFYTLRDEVGSGLIYQPHYEAEGRRER
jgi:hypothetical protein